MLNYCGMGSNRFTGPISGIMRWSDKFFLHSSTAGDGQSRARECHVDEACVGAQRFGMERLADSCRGFGVLCYHVEIAASTSSGELVTETEVIYTLGDGFDCRRIGAAVEGHVLLPGGTDKTTHALEVAALYGVEHLKGVGLHGA